MHTLIKGLTNYNNIQTAGWYQQFAIDEPGISITFVPARHWSRRSLADTNKRLWGGFVLEINDTRIFFSGDSGYDTHYKQIGAIFGGFNYAIMGIGAYEPKWFMHPMHQSPEEALKAFDDLQSQRFIPMHYGTFDLSDEPLQQPLTDLKKAAAAMNVQEKLLILKIGEPLVL